MIYGPKGADHSELSPQDAAQAMFPASVHRGRDAFGWTHYSPSQGLKVVKYPMEGNKHNMRFVSIPDDVHWVLAHVRMATHGTKAYPSNNHPIVHHNWLCVHNGIMDNHDSILARTGRFDDLAEVDSEAIPAAIRRWGVRRGLKALSGDMAAAFVKSTKPSRIYLARLDDRPLVVAEGKDGNWYFASEHAIIQEADIDIKNWHVVEPYHCLVFDDGEFVDYFQFRTPPPRKKKWSSSWDHSAYSTSRVSPNSVKSSPPANTVRHVAPYRDGFCTGCWNETSFDERYSQAHREFVYTCRSCRDSVYESEFADCAQDAINRLLDAGEHLAEM